MNSFNLYGNKIIIKFDYDYCQTEEEILRSDAFSKILLKFLDHKKRHHTLEWDVNLGILTKDITDIFLSLLVFPIRQVLELEPKFEKYLNELSKFYYFVEKFYDYWRKIERYVIIDCKDFKLKRTKFLAIFEEFNDLVIKLYRKICQNILSTRFDILRELPAGANACLLLANNNLPIYQEYKKLQGIPFIKALVFRPPFVCYTKKNIRTENFQELTTNPLKNALLNKKDYFCFPIKVGKQLAFVYFHRKYMGIGVALANLFEHVSEENFHGQKPNIIIVFGATGQITDGIYHDQENDIYLGVLKDSDNIDYFGYLKKLILTVHNFKMLDEKALPVHGAGIHLELMDGTEKNIIIIGDSGAGKSETIEAFKALSKQKVKRVVTIFDDMGSIITEKRLMAYGTEIGAFVRMDDLDHGYAYQVFDRAIFINPHLVNSRLILPISTYDEIIKGYPVDMVLYANNYDLAEKRINILNNVEQAVEIFEAGKRMAKSTTQESGLVQTYFANPFGPLQRQTSTSKLLRNYFKQMFAEGVIVGEILTGLATSNSTENCEKAATELLKIISEDNKKQK